MFKDNAFIDASNLLINSSKLKNSTKVTNNITVNDIELDSKTAKKINKNKGKYITITFNKDNISSDLEMLINQISNSVKDLMAYLKITKPTKTLFIGLGNKDYACDSFGYKMIESLSVTNKTYKIYKDVLGKTNILSIDFIKSITSLLDADLVITFDSLKTYDVNRLGCTIQMSSTGLSPGSAYDSITKVIDKKTIKRPVINIGIPSIINLNNIDKTLPNLVVTTNNIDELVSDLTSIISIALNRVF